MRRSLTMVTMAFVLVLVSVTVVSAYGQLKVTVEMNGEDVSRAVQVIIMGGSMPQMLPPGTEKTIELPAGAYDVMAAPGDEATMGMPAQERVQIVTGETKYLRLQMQPLPTMMPGMGLPGMQVPGQPPPEPESAFQPGEASTEEILRMLQHGTDEEKNVAREELKNRREVVVDLLPLLSVESVAIRHATMDILMVLGSEQPDGMIIGKRPIDDHMEALVPYLRHEDIVLQKGAAQIIVNAWYFPENAVSNLIGLLEHSEAELRVLAAKALGSRGKRPAELGRDLAQALGTALTDSEPEVRHLAAIALVRVEHDPARLAEITAVGLSDPQSEVRVAAAQTLKSFDEGAVAAETELLQALTDEDDQVRAAALQVFAVYPTTELLRHREQMASMLQDPYSGVRVRAVEALALLGAEALPSLSALTESLADSDPMVAQGAVQIFWRFFGEKAEPARPALVQLIQHPDFSFREAASGAALALGAIGVPAITDLERLLNHSDALVRYRAATALNTIGPDAVGTVPALESLLYDETEHDDVRRAAYFTIANITGEEPDL